MALRGVGCPSHAARCATPNQQETGRCPLTNEPLAAEDLVVIKSSKAPKPRPTPATSIPGLLSIFQNVREGGRGD